jgi:hypothetical protein
MCERCAIEFVFPGQDEGVERALSLTNNKRGYSSASVKTLNRAAFILYLLDLYTNTRLDSLALDKLLLIRQQGQT